MIDKSLYITPFIESEHFLSTNNFVEHIIIEDGFTELPILLLHSRTNNRYQIDWKFPKDRGFAVSFFAEIKNPKVIIDCDRVAITVPQKGKGFGCYIFSCLIKWCKSVNPDLEIDSYKLAHIDGEHEDSKLRRNTFYENLGFKIYSSDNGVSGSASVENVSELKEHYNFKDKGVHFINSINLLTHTINVSNKLELAEKAKKENIELNVFFEKRYKIKIRNLTLGILILILIILFNLALK